MTKTALVTGYSSQVGKAICDSLLQADYIVYAGMSQIPSHFSTSPHLIPVKLDITSDISCTRAIPPRLDALINVAGISPSGPFTNASPQDFSHILDINVVGAFRLAKAALPMLHKSESGRIINISSLSGFLPTPNFSLYSASKHALQALGWAAALELRSSHVYVTTVAPGALYSPTHQKFSSHTPARLAVPILGWLLPLTQPREVGNRVLSLLAASSPPPLVLIGRDSKLLYLLQKLLPPGIWFNIQNWLWQKQQ